MQRFGRIIAELLANALKSGSAPQQAQAATPNWYRDPHDYAGRTINLWPGIDFTSDRHPPRKRD